MPRLKKADQNTILEWQYDPFRTLKGEIEALLVDIHEDHRRLSSKGTPLDYRVTVAKQAAVARHLLNTIRACNASTFRKDIL